MLFHPDVLAGQLPAPFPQVEALSARAFQANVEAGLGFGVLVAHLDGYEDWALRQDDAFAAGLFRSLLEAVVPNDAVWVCGIRQAGIATFYLQPKTPEELRLLASSFCDDIRKVNLAPRGGPVRLTVSVGVAHSSGFQGPDQAIEHIEFAAKRASRLVTRTGGDQFAMIERFGPKPLAPPVEAAEAWEPESDSTDMATRATEYEIPGPPNALEGLVQQGGEAQPLDAQALAAALRDRYGDAFEQLLNGRDRAWEQRVENLERRLAKLGSMMQATPGSAVSTGDVGIASRFRTVQGLDEDDAYFEAKQGLMSALYLANQKLRGQVQGRSA